MPLSDRIASGLQQPRRLLRQRNFRLYATGQFFTLAGTRLHEIAAGWLMWQLTGSAAWVGLLAVANMLPRLILWPFTGVVADRRDQKRTAMIFQSLAALATGAMATLNTLGLLSPWLMLLFMALIGVSAAFWQPIRLIIAYRIVGGADYPAAVAFSSVVANIARVAGPAAGSVIVAAGAGTSLAFALNAASFLVSTLTLHRMTMATQTIPRLPRADIGREIWRGISVLWSDAPIRHLMLAIGAFALLIRSVPELLPVYAEHLLASDAVGFAWLMSAFGAGSLCAGLGLVTSEPGPRPARAMTLYTAVTVVGTALFAINRDYWGALALVGIIGYGAAGANITGQVLVQTRVTDEVRGRVLSVYAVAFNCMPGAGALLLGLLIDRFGPSLPTIAAALLCGSLVVLRRAEGRRLDPP